MKTFRIVVGILALIPLSLLMDNLFFHPQFYGEGSPGELTYLLFGVPIFIRNFLGMGISRNHRGILAWQIKWD